MSESSRKHKANAPKTLNFGVFVCSTSRYQLKQKGEKIEDISGDLIVTLLENAGHRISFKDIISDDKKQIEVAFKKTLATSVDAAIFCGGTGITNTDVTIETVEPMLEKTLFMRVQSR